MQENVRFQLMVRRGPQPNQSYEITQELTTLGRDITNDIVINDRETSRHHLRLLRSGDGITLEDLGSTNGTFVNGKRVAGVTPLQNGDMIGLGETVTLGLDIKRPPQPAPVTPPPASDELDTPPPAESAYAAAPVQPPEHGYQPAAPADPYAPPAGQAHPQQQPSYPAYAEQPPQPAGYGIPAPPQQYAGYDYDPYAVREEGGSSSWLIVGCFVFFVLAFVCFGIVGLVLIDTLNLWCEVPLVTQVVTAMGYCA